MWVWLGESEEKRRRVVVDVGEEDSDVGARRVRRVRRHYPEVEAEHQI